MALLFRIFISIIAKHLTIYIQSTSGKSAVCGVKVFAPCIAQIDIRIKNLLLFFRGNTGYR